MLWWSDEVALAAVGGTAAGCLGKGNAVFIYPEPFASGASDTCFFCILGHCLIIIINPELYVDSDLKKTIYSLDSAKINTTSVLNTVYLLASTNTYLVIMTYQS